MEHSLHPIVWGSSRNNSQHRAQYSNKYSNKYKDNCKTKLQDQVARTSRKNNDYNKYYYNWKIQNMTFPRGSGFSGEMDSLTTHCVSNT